MHEASTTTPTACCPGCASGIRCGCAGSPTTHTTHAPIEVFWRDRQLGYLPRLDNAAAPSLLDRAHTLRAEIIGIDDPDEEWEPVKLRVWVSKE